MATKKPKTKTDALMPLLAAACRRLEKAEVPFPPIVAQWWEKNRSDPTPDDEKDAPAPAHKAAKTPPSPEILAAQNKLHEMQRRFQRMKSRRNHWRDLALSVGAGTEAEESED